MLTNGMTNICSNDLEIVKAKTYEDAQGIRTSFCSDGLDQFSEGKRYQCDTSYSSSSLHSSRTLADELMLQNYSKRLDPEILSEKARKIFLIDNSHSDEWICNFTDKCLKIDNFLRDGTFKEMMELSFNQNELKTKQTIVLTLDYHTNLVTFTFFLLWKWTVNENQHEMTYFVQTQNAVMEFLELLLKFRTTEFVADGGALSHVIEAVVHPFPKIDLLRECQKPIIIIRPAINPFQTNELQSQCVLPWNPQQVAHVLSTINQQFFAELQLKQMIVKGGLNSYFRRINTLSQYIIYSVVRFPIKHKRQEALGYWLDLAENLMNNYDLEGLFVVYKYGIQLLVKDYISTMPLLFRDQTKIHKINTFYDTNIKNNSFDIQDIQGCKAFYIPSFHKYTTQLRRYEQQKKIHREQIANILEQLVTVSKQQRQMYIKNLALNESLSADEQYIISALHPYIQKELENKLKIPLDKDTLVYIELIKLAKNGQ